MTVYLELGTSNFYNLSNAKKISINWDKSCNELSTRKGYLCIDGDLYACDFCEEALSPLYFDIIKALLADKNNQDDTVIEAFNMNAQYCYGSDKYGQIVNKCHELIENNRQKKKKNKKETV